MPLILGPARCLVHVDVIVVAEAVAFFDLAVGMQQVVLGHLAFRSVVTGGELVEVCIGVGSQQVVHRLVVMRPGEAGVQADTEFVGGVDIFDIIGCKAQHLLVAVTALHIIFGFPAFPVGYRVLVVEVVPLNLAVGLVGLPVINEGVVLFEEIAVLVQPVAVVLGFVPDVETR